MSECIAERWVDYIKILASPTWTRLTLEQDRWDSIAEVYIQHEIKKAADNDHDKTLLTTD